MAENVTVLEILNPPSDFALKTTNPPAYFDGQSLLAWVLPALPPGQAMILSYSTTLQASVPLGSTVTGGPAVLSRDKQTGIACFIKSIEDDAKRVATLQELRARR